MVTSAETGWHYGNDTGQGEAPDRYLAELDLGCWCWFVRSGVRCSVANGMVDYPSAVYRARIIINNGRGLE